MLSEDRSTEIEELVRRAQSGDESAFDVIARRYRAAVLAVTFSRTQDRDDAEDLAQEVLVRAREKLKMLREPGSFPAWLRTTALNVCRTWYRRSRPWPDSLDTIPDGLAADAGPKPLEVLLEKEKQREFHRALLSIPAANRYALLMHVWGGYSYDEISRFVEAPANTIAGRIHRAKTQLRRVLGSRAADEICEPHRRTEQ